MDALAYLLLQMGLEGKELVGGHTIKQIKVVPGEELPLILLAQLADQNLVAYYGESLSSDLQAQLSACVSSIEFPEIDPILDVLKSHTIRYRPLQNIFISPANCNKSWSDLPTQT
jgi:hypothetical protein